MKPDISDGKIEIEHKFLVKQPLNIPLQHSKYLIVQNYLKAEKGISERVRCSMDINNLEQVYTYTKKVPQLIGCLEFEEEISKEEYDELLKLKDFTCRTIVKTRTVFKYNDFKFELDNFVEPISFSMVEIEVESLQENIKFPEFIEVITDVTKESEFKNGSIGRDPLSTKKKIKKLKNGTQ